VGREEGDKISRPPLGPLKRRDRDCQVFPFTGNGRDWVVRGEEEGYPELTLLSDFLLLSPSLATEKGTWGWGLIVQNRLIFGRTSEAPTSLFLQLREKEK
jgi:hypothetical protein